ncbi:mannan endo-1,4-beta-mannosidase 1 [Nicotiana attenuata]|uniref:mannan endo-1,4-beta-mannosidase n=1 Tax=Nicotiana attenuata TaxID=49451 RepID=A0A314LC02_NICAT|nr:mannan endo-1,4-beta-mannosidase 1 [Nicotiana attenuata]
MSFTRTCCISGLLLLFLALTCEARVPRNANVGFIAVNSAHFELNGSPFLFNGFNSYWLMHVAAEPSERYKVTEGLDFVISEAKKYDVHLILSFVNNWNDFGGKAQYIQWARNAGAQINGDHDFYTHPILKDYYKNHIKAWVQEMASFVKSLDNKHLLEVGMEGFYGDLVPERKQVNPGYQVGTDFISNHLINEIDFVTIHAYTDQWVSGQNDEAQLAWMQRWVTSDWEDARTILKKPLVLAEFGKSSRGQGYNLSSRDIFMSNVYRNIYNLAKEGGTMAGSLVWQLMAQGMENYDDGYCIVLGQNPSTAGIISGQSHAMTALTNLIHNPLE